MTATMPLPVVLVPALLCDDALFRGALDALDTLDVGGPRVDARVMVASHADMATNVAEILAQAPERFVLAGA